ncbi:hypothetical protein PGTUg99_034340 [Puccinia graminis f. sp. tritici]|uniref:Uncharacterized protein n=1 Tax=Puccinia graminis f. sp. tritici TaxID=56615 RepID=A0A5B0QS69_PUCGR|nr:hypothetical protein PGTUg99_034340 [Puccinia graminis f. sp. tritici]
MSAEPPDRTMMYRSYAPNLLGILLFDTGFRRKPCTTAGTIGQLQFLIDEILRLAGVQANPTLLLMVFIVNREGSTVSARVKESYTSNTSIMEAA